MEVKPSARSDRERSYWRLKRADGEYSARRETLLSTPMFRAWLVQPRTKQEFSVAEGGVVPLSRPGRPHTPVPLISPIADSRCVKRPA